MKKYILTLIIIFNLQIVCSQSNFSNGFNDGYKKGYCHNQGVGCMSPLPPNAPIPSVNENINNYQDGYNRGFEAGLSAKKAVGNNSTRERFTAQNIELSQSNIYVPNFNSIKEKLLFVNNLIKEALNDLNNRNYENALSKADKILLIAPNVKEYSYYIKSYIYTDLDIEPLLAYNYGLYTKSHWIDNNPKFLKLLVANMKFYLESYMRNEDYNGLLNICKNIWEENNLSNYFLGLSYYYLNDFESAKKAFKKANSYQPADEYFSAIKQNKTIPNPYIVNKISESERNQTIIVNKISESERDQTIINHSENIKKYYKEKNYDKILSILEPIENSINIGKIKNKNDIFFVFANKAICNYSLKKYTNAISDATVAINNNNNYDEIANLYFVRAMSKTQLKDYYGSNSDYDYLIDNYAENKYKENSLGTLLNNKAYNLILLKDFKNAKPLVNKALSLENNINYIWDTKGELEYNLGDYNECIKAMTMSIDLEENVESRNSYLYRGLAKIKLGKKAEGCSDLSKAGELGEKRAYDEIKKYCN